MGYSSTSADEVARLRWMIVGSLSSRAEPADLAELKLLQSDLPEIDLRRDIASAEDQYRTLNPAYPDPKEVMMLAADPQRLPIRSDYELQQAVLLALENVQRAISEQEQPEASVFWMPAGPRKGDGLTPRDEEFVSNYIAGMLRRELSSRGISVTRESEVARGNETDIRVEAPSNASEGRTDAAVVIIEVKCIWNRDVPDSLFTQLAERYLRLAGRTHGIYVVVDFAREH